MDLDMYRCSPLEQQRIANISRLMPRDARSVLDAGASDGYISLILAKTFDSVVALDLIKPQVRHSRIQSVEGDITSLSYPDRSFDMVLCTEVLEYLPTPLLRMACRELRRVARRYILVGVPYKQDLRIGRTTCHHCASKNPPWSHLHTFTEQRLYAMFPSMEVENVAYVGSHRDRTNSFSTKLLDWAGNPDGTYEQEEPCVYCGQKLKQPPACGFVKKAMAKTAITLNKAQSSIARPQPNWIHVLLRQPKRLGYPAAIPFRRSRPEPVVTRASA